jgi:glyoxylase-like metal-dependent hydrolase (beta-lactamase superfamily II)
MRIPSVNAFAGCRTSAASGRGVDARRRRFLQGIAAASAALAGSGPWRWARAQSGAGGAPTLAELRDGLVLVAGAGGNVVLAQAAEGAVVIDSGSPAGAQALGRALAARIGSTPVRALFNTHWHLDHTGGNEAVAPSGTTIVAHENTRLWMSTKFYVEWEDRYYPPRPVPALPNETFFSSDPQPLKISVGTLAAEYGHLPEAHTDGDLYVRFPQQNVIVAGGAVTGGRYPVLDYITGGWIGGLAEATKKLLEMSDADTLIVPDAGPPQRRADLEAQLAMLETVRERIEAIALQGRGVEDMIAEDITKEFDERYGGDSAQFIANAYEGLWWNRLRGIVA